jgi:hypothetical protein
MARTTEACSGQLEVGAQFVAQHGAAGQRVRDSWSRSRRSRRLLEKRVIFVQLVIAPQLLERARGHFLKK